MAEVTGATVEVMAVAAAIKVVGGTVTVLNLVVATGVSGNVVGIVLKPFGTVLNAINVV